MDFEKTVPDWSAEGTEPPASLKSRGFQAGDKPPAPYFNWFMNRVSACLKELQEKWKAVRSVALGGTGRSDVPSGSYLVGNGTGIMNVKTPEQVRQHIGAPSRTECIPIVDALSADGALYTADVPGVTELQNGMLLTIIPEINSATNTPALNVNGLGGKMIRLALSFNTAAVATPRLENYFSAGRPITLQYDATYQNGVGIWKTFGKQKTSAQDLYGAVPIESGGTGATTAQEAREELEITLENLGDIIIAESTPETVTDGKWYLIKSEV